MKKLDLILEKLNFKKAIKLYLILSVFIMLVCVASTLFISREKLKMAWNYEKVSHTFRDKTSDASLKSQLGSLMASSSEVKNIIMVGRDNSILYKINDTLIKNSKVLQFTQTDNHSNYLIDNVNKNVIYKVVKDDDILINKDFIDNHKKIESDINDSYSFEKDLGTNDIYLLNYMVQENTGNKLFIIRSVIEIPNLEMMLKITFAVLVLIFALYWIGLALWVYKDANKKNTNGPLWGLLVLVTNIVGVIVYLMFKQNSILCNQCGALQNKNNKHCSNCGVKINATCKKCGNIVTNDENYCKNCGDKQI